MDIQEINTAIKSQEEDYNEIRRIITNIKKDSVSRRTQKYIDEKRQTLTTIFQRVQENHSKLEKQEMLSSHKYITTNYFGNIQKQYNEGLAHLQNYEARLQLVQAIYEPEEQNTNEEEGRGNPKTFIQMFRISQMSKRLIQAKESVTENKPIWHLQTTINNLQKRWQDIEETHIELLLEEDTSGHLYFKNKYFENTQIEFDTTMEMLEEKIHDSSSEKITLTQSSGKLPRISIPTFTGSYDSWYTFHDLFKKIIHEDKNISLVEKMQYLKTNVKGDAAKIIRHLTISESNYETAWKLLTQRYEDERMISIKFIDKLLDLPKLNVANAAGLRDMHDTIKECLESLKHQGIDISTWDPILARLLARKWDQQTDSKYEDQLQHPNKLESFEEMLQFLEKRFKSLKSYDQQKITYNHLSNNSVNHTINKYRGTLIPIAESSKSKHCWYCKSTEHNINKCPSFKTLNVTQRYKEVSDKEMCKRCLNHDKQIKCTSEFYTKCEICQHKGHNTLLHRTFDSIKRQPESSEYTKKFTPKPTMSDKKQNTTLSNLSATNLEAKNTVLLATALLQTTSYDGTPQLLRVLCDQGSEASFCTEEVAQLLSYPRQKVRAEIKGIGDNEPKTSKYTININLQPRYSSEYRLPVTLIVLPKLTNSLPRSNLQQLQELDNVLLADPTYNKKGPIDIILGAQEYSKILLQGFKRLQGGIIAQETELGWILSGLYPQDTNGGIKVLSMMTRTDDIQQLTKFWELEEIPRHYALTKDDELCENYYTNTTIRSFDGTYTVRLPFKDANIKYGESRKKAVARLLQLERQFEKNENLRQQYKEFMYEYLNMGHMRKVPKPEYYTGEYYIPHQAVIKEDSLTTKLRVVFDASSKTSSKISLNENLHKGPRLQQDLSNILLRWRTHKIAFMADIMKMYRFIKINQEDYKYQRILWRFSPKKAISEYELTTVTYGTTSAPYLAVRTLQQLALDEQDNYPIASRVTLQDFSMLTIFCQENPRKAPSRNYKNN